MKEKTSCGGILYRENNGELKFLVTKHREDKGGHWHFPKGPISPGETCENAAVRAVFEETGLKVNFDDGFNESIEYCPEPDTCKKVHFFLGKPKSFEVRYEIDELEEHAWMSYEDACERVSYENAKELLSKARTFLQ